MGGSIHFFNISKRLLANILVDLPGLEWMTLAEYILDLLQCPSSSFGEHEDDMDGSKDVEDTKDEVGNKSLHEPF